VIDILREKRPEARIPDEDSFHEHPDAENCLESMPVFCYHDHVAKRAVNLKGGAGPCGVEGIMLRNWLLRHEVRSEKLREEMALWTELLSNGSPPYAAYRALNAARQLAAEKKPSGVRPLECGESWMRLMSGCNNDQTRTQATIACGNAQLCAGLRAGIEGNLHAVGAVWPQSAGWTHDGGIPSATEEDELAEDDAPQTQQSPVQDSLAAEDPLVDAGANEDDEYSGYEEGTGFGMALFDAEMHSVS